MSHSQSPPSPSRGLKRKHENDSMESRTEAIDDDDRASFERERQAIWGLSMTKLSKYQANGYQQLRRAVLVWQTMRTVFQSYQVDTEQVKTSENESKEENEKETGMIATDSGDENAESDATDVDVYMETGRRETDDASSVAPADEISSATPQADCESLDGDSRKTAAVVANQNKRVCCVRLCDEDDEERGSRANENGNCFGDSAPVETYFFVESGSSDEDGEEDDDDSGVGDMGTSADADEEFLTVLLGRSSLSQNTAGVYGACSLEATTSSSSNCLAMKVLEN